MTDENLSKLEKRVGSLETYFKVAVVVAAIFGVGGGFGAVALRTAHTEVAGLQQAVAGLKVDVGIVREDLEGVTVALSDAVTEHLAALEHAKSAHLSEIASSGKSVENGILELHSNLEESLAGSVEREIASQLAATIDPRFTAIETALSHHQILAAVTVVGRRLVSSKSSTGVRYDQDTGIVTFPNPRNLEYLVVVGDYGSIMENRAYRTTKNFLRSYISSTEFRVWNTTLNTGDRNGAPNGFTALILKVN